MIGEQYGSWTIIEQVEDYTSGNSSQRQWLCRCVCGHTRKFTTYSIRKQTKPCSHIWGKRFGKLVVIAQVERPAQIKTGTFVRCKCDCGKIISVIREALLWEMQNHAVVQLILLMI